MPEAHAPLLSELVAVGRAMVGRPAQAAVLSNRAGVLVVEVVDVVLKAHAETIHEVELASRLLVASRPPGNAVLLSPLAIQGAAGRAQRLLGRLVSAWPRGERVSPDEPDSALWHAAGALLARLHGIPLSEVASASPPRAGSPARVNRALAGLRNSGDDPDGRAVLMASRTLPAWTRGEDRTPSDRPKALVHGDWHLGQLVRYPPGSSSSRVAEPWLLIDVDDLGTASCRLPRRRLHPKPLLPARRGVLLSTASTIRTAGREASCGCCFRRNSDPLEHRSVCRLQRRCWKRTSPA